MVSLAPQVHANGTSRVVLQEGYMAALNAVMDAHAMVAATAPNGRDYYLRVDSQVDGMDEAVRQHRRRLRDLVAIQRELIEILEALEG